MAQASTGTGISANRLELLQIADAVAREKSIDRKIVIQAMEDAIQKAAKSRYGSENDIRCEIDPKTGETKLARVLHGLQRFEAHPDVLTRPLDVAQIGIVCVLGYLDFRFPDSGWRKAFPKLNAFNEAMMQRESVKISVPPT